MGEYTLSKILAQLLARTVLSHFFSERTGQHGQNLFYFREQLVITACADSTIRLFDMKSGQLTLTLQGHSNSVDFMSFDGNLLISAGSDRFDDFA